MGFIVVISTHPNAVEAAGDTTDLKGSKLDLNDLFSSAANNSLSHIMAAALSGFANGNAIVDAMRISSPFSEAARKEKSEKELSTRDIVVAMMSRQLQEKLQERAAELDDLMRKLRADIERFRYIQEQIERNGIAALTAEDRGFIQEKSPAFYEKLMTLEEKETNATYRGDHKAAQEAKQEAAQGAGAEVKTREAVWEKYKSERDIIEAIQNAQEKDQLLSTTLDGKFSNPILDKLQKESNMSVIELTSNTDNLMMLLYERSMSNASELTAPEGSINANIIVSATPKF